MMMLAYLAVASATAAQGFAAASGVMAQKDADQRMEKAVEGRRRNVRKVDLQGARHAVDAEYRGLRYVDASTVEPIQLVFPAGF